MNEAKHMKRYSVGPIGALEAQAGVPDDGLWVTATVAREMLEALKAVLANKDACVCCNQTGHNKWCHVPKVESAIAMAEGKEADRG